MNITVNSILAMPNFYGFDIIAGKDGLNRKVSSVSVMDAPDIYNWLKGEEILISTGYIMKDSPHDLLELVSKIEKAGAAALFIKLKRFIYSLPQEIIDLANQLNFPIISVPINCSFTDIINPVLSYIVNEQTKKLQHSEKIHKSFTQLVINGGDTMQIIDTLSGIIHKDVVFYDIYFKKIYPSSKDKDIEEYFNSTPFNNILEQHSYFSIRIDKTNYGYLIFPNSRSEDNVEDFDAIAIEHASTVLKLDIQKKISNHQIEYRYRHEFIQDLILNNIKSLEEVNYRANLYGWNFNNGLLSIIVDIDNFKDQYLKITENKNNNKLEKIRDMIFNISKDLMEKNFDKVTYAEFSDSIVFLICPEEADIDDFSCSVKKVSDMIRALSLEKCKFTVTIGIGDYKPSVMDTYISYNESQKAVKLGRILYNKNRTVFYRELKVYKFLESIYNTKEAKDFCESTLGKLYQYDIKHKTDLSKTLQYISKNNWNLKSTSEEMFIHYNTIKYKYKKICEILDKDLDSFEERLEIYLSLKLLNMIE